MTRLPAVRCWSWPALALSETFGGGEELSAAEVLVGVHRELDPAGFTPGDLEGVVGWIVVEQGRVAVHGDGFPPGRREEFALVSRPSRSVLTARFGDHQLHRGAITPWVADQRSLAELNDVRSILNAVQLSR